MTDSIDIPHPLIQKIKDGDCVVFIGAGFSMPALPHWFDLIKKLSKRVKEGRKKDIENLLESLSKNNSPTSGIVGYEMAAQLIKAAMPEGSDFHEALKSELDADEVHLSLLNTRLKCLGKIPFAAVLTTNFDRYLKGKLPGGSVYREVLRSHAVRWTHKYPGQGLSSQQSTQGDNRITIKLHGDIGKVGTPVFTSQDYRKRLFSEVGYLNFLRSLMSTRTVLFLGFSFSDPYLNLIRDEVMVQLEERKSDHPSAFALLPDMSCNIRTYLRKHDGLHILSYDSKCGKSHEPFDRFLGDLVKATDPLALAPELVSEKRILWLDPNPVRNGYAVEYLGKGTVTIAVSLEQALGKLRVSERHFDLVISHWGHKSTLPDRTTIATGKDLLTAMRSENITVPLIIFASGLHYKENRKEALALGAYEYTYTFPGLLQEIERMFS